MRNFGLLILCLWLSACTGVPEGVIAINNFDQSRYLGQWYEVARIENRFEKGLHSVTATYTARDDGGINVINQGYSAAEQSWQKAEGKAYFVGSPDTAHLKVSFFGPFYASYVVFKLDPDYRYAFVTGNTKEYLWLLSRTPDVSDQIKQAFLDDAEALGYELNQLVWVDQQIPKAIQSNPNL
jgi:apolipoprotein D and lipocalin family protein